MQSYNEVPNCCDIRNNFVEPFFLQGESVDISVLLRHRSQPNHVIIIPIIFSVRFALSSTEYRVRESQREVTVTILRYGDLQNTVSVCKFAQVFCYVGGVGEGGVGVRCRRGGVYVWDYVCADIIFGFVGGLYAMG